MNAYEMLELFRDNLNEANEAVHSDLNLVRRLNRAQNRVALRTQLSASAWLTKSVSVTPVASVITLPADCSKPIMLIETLTQREVPWLLSVSHVNVYRTNLDAYDSGIREAYPLRQTLVVNEDSYTTACTLYYQVRPPDLVISDSVAESGENYILLPDNLNTKRIDDYYNDVYFEIWDSTTEAVRVLATDYDAATRKVVVSGTFSGAFDYGSISFLPEETHGLIVLEATVSALGKPSTNMDKDVFAKFLSELREERNLVDEWLSSRIPGATRSVLIGEEY
jgi:hypothetical protein